jgi:hypothetical protein
VASRPLLDFFAYLSPAHSGARKFYDELTANLRTEGEDVLHRYLTDNSMILEQRMTGTVVGSLLGLPAMVAGSAFASCRSWSFATA